MATKNYNLITTDELADKLNCSRKTISRQMAIWKEEYGLVVVKMGGRWLFDEESVNQMINKWRW